MGLICEYLKLPYVMEFNKAYPRDWLNPGRLRVLLREKDGTYINDEAKTKKELMGRMGELIPQLKSRHVPATSSTNQAQVAPKTKKKKH